MVVIEHLPSFAADTQDEEEGGGSAASSGGSAAAPDQGKQNVSPSPLKKRVMFNLETGTSLELEPPEEPNSFRAFLTSLGLNPVVAEGKYKDLKPVWKIIGSLKQPSLRMTVLEFARTMISHSNDVNRRQVSVGKFESAPTESPYIPTSIRLNTTLTYPPEFADDAEIAKLSSDMTALVDKAKQDIASTMGACARRLEKLVRMRRLNYFAESLLDIITKSLIYFEHWKRETERKEYNFARPRRLFAGICAMSFYEKHLVSPLTSAHYTNSYLQCTDEEAKNAILDATSRDQETRHGVYSYNPALTADENTLIAKVTDFLNSFLEPVTSELQQSIDRQAAEARVNAKCSALYKAEAIETATAATADALVQEPKFDQGSLETFITKAIDKKVAEQQLAKPGKRPRTTDNAGTKQPKKKKAKKSSKNGQGGRSAQKVAKPNSSKKNGQQKKKRSGKGSANQGGNRNDAKSGSKKKQKKQNRNKKRKS